MSQKKNVEFRKMCEKKVCKTKCPRNPIFILLSDVPADFNIVNKSTKIQTVQPSDEDSKYRVESSKT